MISTTSAIHHILTLGGVNSSIIIGSGSDTKSTLDQRSAASTNDNAIAMDEDDTQQQQQPTCYICYETHDTNNNPTQRYCACRGTSGYVHTSCLLNYTQQQMIIQQQYNNHNSMRKLKPSTLLYCSICKNRYNQPLYSKLRNVILDSITKKSKSDKRHGRLINLHTLISVGLGILYIFDILCILDVITFDDNNVLSIFDNYELSLNFIPTIMPTLHITQNLLILSIDILIFLLLTSQVSINTKSYTYCYISFLISRSLFSYKIGLYHGISTSALALGDSGEGVGEEGGEMDVWSKMGCNIFKLVYDSKVWSVDERLLLGCADQL